MYNLQSCWVDLLDEGHYHNPHCHQSCKPPAAVPGSAPFSEGGVSLATMPCCQVVGQLCDTRPTTSIPWGQECPGRCHHCCPPRERELTHVQMYFLSLCHLNTPLHLHIDTFSVIIMQVYSRYIQMRVFKLYYTQLLVID